MCQENQTVVQLICFQESSFTLWILNSFALQFRQQFHSPGPQLIWFGVQQTVSLFRFSTHLHQSSENRFNLWVLNSFALEFRKKLITLQDLSSFALDFRKPVSFFSFSIFLLGLQKTVSLFRFLTQCFWSSENIFTLWVLKSFVSEFTKQFHSLVSHPVCKQRNSFVLEFKNLTDPILQFHCGADPHT